MPRDVLQVCAMPRLALLLLLLLAACPAEPDRPFCEPGRACVAASEAHSANGIEAARYGRAAFADTCVAKDDATCSASTQTCKLWGQCHAPVVSGGSACADSDRDFLASRDPRCTKDTCVALGDDCKSAEVCGLEGRCTARDGVCVADPASCKASTQCKALGWCSFVGAECRPASIADCANTTTCRDHGNCGFARGQCASCTRSPECREEGLCWAYEGRCLAFTSQHCAQSAACRQGQRCTLFGGACVR